MKIDMYENWAEVLALLFMVVGFVISILLFNNILSYISVVLAGGITGRIYYLKRHAEPIFPFILIISGFLLGYLLGGFWVNRLVVLILFLVSWWGSYKLHVKKIFVIFKSQRFVK